MDNLRAYIHNLGEMLKILPAPRTTGRKPNAPTVQLELSDNGIAELLDAFGPLAQRRQALESAYQNSVGDLAEGSRTTFLKFQCDSSSNTNELREIAQAFEQRFQIECAKMRQNLAAFLQQHQAQQQQQQQQWLVRTPSPQPDPLNVEQFYPSRAFSTEAKILLEQAWLAKQQLTRAERVALAKECGISPKQIVTYYANRKSREKRSTKSERGIHVQKKPRLSVQGRNSPVPSLSSSRSSSSSSFNDDDSRWITSGTLVPSPTAKQFESLQDTSFHWSGDTIPVPPDFGIDVCQDWIQNFTQQEVPSVEPAEAVPDIQAFFNSQAWSDPVQEPTAMDEDLCLPELFAEVIQPQQHSPYHF